MSIIVILPFVIVYVGEASPPEIRGWLVTFINANITFGSFIAAIISGAFSTVFEGWRYMLGLAALPAVIQFFGFLFLPESPRWLMEKGYVAKAAEVLKSLRNGKDVTEEIEEIQRVIDEKRLQRGKKREASGSFSVRKSEERSGEHRLCDTVNVLHPESEEKNYREKSRDSATKKEKCFALEEKNTTSTDRGGFYNSLLDTYASTKYLINELFYVSTTRRALLVGCGLQAAQQISGINTIM